MTTSSAARTPHTPGRRLQSPAPRRPRATTASYAKFEPNTQGRAPQRGLHRRQDGVCKACSEAGNATTTARHRRRFQDLLDDFSDATLTTASPTTETQATTATLPQHRNTPQATAHLQCRASPGARRPARHTNFRKTCHSQQETSDSAAAQRYTTATAKSAPTARDDDVQLHDARTRTCILLGLPQFSFFF